MFSSKQKYKNTKRTEGKYRNTKIEESGRRQKVGQWICCSWVTFSKTKNTKALKLKKNTKIEKYKSTNRYTEIPKYTI